MLLRTAPSGGMVFSVGTTDWPLALDTDSNISRITANVVDRFAHRALRIHGPVCPESEYVGEGDMIGPGRDVTWYVNGDQIAEHDLTGIEWQVRGGSPASNEGSRLVTRSGADEQWLTLTATARDGHGHTYFGSRTVRVLSADEYARRRLVRILNAIAFPDEQGGALVDQLAAEGDLADRVIPVRLPWVRHYAETLSDLMDQLTAIWTANGRMAEGSLQPDDL
jgi:hypothetical protein